jgi:putative peptidoglycan lipid II flippase
VVAAPPAPRSRRPARRRRWPIVALLGASAIVAAVLATGISLGSDDPAAEPITIASTQAFDPEGNPPGDEHNAEAPLAADGDDATVWTTETYRDPAVLGKRGVGLVVRFDELARIDALRVTSESTNWTASIYLTDAEVGADLASWGDPVATAAGLGPPVASFAIDGGRARAVLIWITRMGDDGRVGIAEVQASG